jgi:ubiquinone/menaquinone biosynthesis C-methylase UbiE
LVLALRPQPEIFVLVAGKAAPVLILLVAIPLRVLIHLAYYELGRWGGEVVVTRTKFGVWALETLSRRWFGAVLLAITIMHQGTPVDIALGARNTSRTRVVAMLLVGVSLSSAFYLWLGTQLAPFSGEFVGFLGEHEWTVGAVVGVLAVVAFAASAVQLASASRAVRGDERPLFLPDLLPGEVRQGSQVLGVGTKADELVAPLVALGAHITSVGRADEVSPDRDESTRTAEALPFADSSFDLAVTPVVFPEPADGVDALLEIARVTRPNGLLVTVIDHGQTSGRRATRLLSHRVAPAGFCLLTSRKIDSRTTVALLCRDDHRPEATRELATRSTRAHYEVFPFVQGGERRVRHWQRRLRPFLPDAALRESVVLEVGCGSGEATRGLIDRGAQVIAVDLTDTAVQRTQLLNPEAMVFQANALCLPLPDSSVDHSVSIGVLHHTADCFAGLAELARVTRPGGSIVVMLYARWTLYHAVYVAAAPLRRHVPVTALRRVPHWCWHIMRVVVAAQVGQWRADTQLASLLADQLWTPRATFHSARMIARWAATLDLTVHRRKRLYLHANLVELRRSESER